MRYILVIILFCLHSGHGYCQRYYVDTTILGRLADPPVTLGTYYSYTPTGDDSVYFFISFVQNGHTQTEIFTEYQGFERAYDTIHIEARQLDGKGMPEIIATFYAADHGIGSWWEQSEIHIWNLNTYMEMFSDVFAYEAKSFNINGPDRPTDSAADNPSDSIMAINDSINNLQEKVAAACVWSYEIQFDDNGILIISPFKIEAIPEIDPAKIPDWTCGPKYVAGTYVIKNGVYVLKKK